MSFLDGAADAVKILDDFAQKHGLSGLALADHIGFRCEAHETFVALRTELEKESRYIYQSIISNRPIAVICLEEPLQTQLGPIRFLELADQKPDGSQSKGFDHIEIVPQGMSCEELQGRLAAAEEQVVEKVRPHHSTWDVQLPGLTIRLEKEPLIEKIKREEMG